MAEDDTAKDTAEDQSEDEKTSDEKSSKDEGSEDEANIEARAPAVEENTYTSDSKKCEECGEPIDHLRVTCPNCGREYTDEEKDEDREAGTEFRAGAAVDEEGNEDTSEGGRDGEPDSDDEATSDEDNNDDDG
jgi:hypothetical protein